MHILTLLRPLLRKSNHHSFHQGVYYYANPIYLKLAECLKIPYHYKYPGKLFCNSVSDQKLISGWARIGYDIFFVNIRKSTLQENINIIHPRIIWLHLMKLSTVRRLYIRKIMLKITLESHSAGVRQWTYFGISTWFKQRTWQKSLIVASYMFGDIDLNVPLLFISLFKLFNKSVNERKIFLIACILV